MLLVPPGIPFMVPEAEADHETLIVTVPPDFTAYATNSTGQSYSMYWAYMATDPLYSGIVEFTKCDGSNVGLSSHEAYSGNLIGDWKFYAIPVCDSSGNLINTSSIASSGCSPAYETLLPIGTNTITCTATDTAGNTGTASFNVNVILQESSDTTLPVITFTASPQNGSGSSGTTSTLTVQATNSTGQNAYFQVLENGQHPWNINNGINTTCSASPVPTYTVSGSLSTSPSYWWKYGATFPIGTTTVTCTGTDDDGNVGTASLTINVILEDPPVAPTITASAYTNSTSPYRTLQLGAPATFLEMQPIHFTIYKGGTMVYPYEKLCHGGPSSAMDWNDTTQTCYQDGTPLALPRIGETPDVQIPIPEAWEAGTYTLVWNVYAHSTSDCDTNYNEELWPSSVADNTPNSDGNWELCFPESSVSFTIPALPEPLTPTITATAYLNATSSTGRTIAVTASNLDPSLYSGTSSVYIENTVWKDGVGALSWPVCGGWNYQVCMEPNAQIVEASFWMAETTFPDGAWQVEIPEDWEAGTYEVQMTAHVGSLSTDSSVSFTIPALPEPLTPTITATAYLNATSSTGRTIALTASNLDPSLYSISNDRPMGNPQNDCLSPSQQNTVLCHVYIDNTIWKDGVGALSWPVCGGWSFNCMSPDAFDVEASFWINHNTSPDGAWQVEIPEDWEAGTYEVQMTVHVGSSSTESNVSFTVPALGEPLTPTITATAYLNTTSSTERTFAVTASNLDPSLYSGTSEVFISNTVWKDGVGALSWPVCERGFIGCDVPVNAEASFWMSMYNQHTDGTFQVEIPEDWEAGTYEVQMTARVGSLSTESSVSFTVPALPGTEVVEIVVPDWIKSNAGWWADGLIDDRTFVTGLQWLISNGIMNIPPTEQGAGSDDVIPGWIKSNAGWWANGLIDDRAFVTGLQWLITNGIMVIG